MRGPSTRQEGATATRGIAAGAGVEVAGGGRGANADTTNGRGRGGGRAAQIIAAAGRGRRFRRTAADAEDEARTPTPPARTPPAGGGGGGGGGGFGGGFATWDRPLGGCESGFTLPDLTDPNIVWASCYGNEVTRYDHRDEARAVGEPVDPHARLAAEQAQVSLSLDAAAGDRSVRSQHGLLRLPGHLQDVEWRSELERDQPRSLDERPDARRVVGRHRRGQPRPVLRRGRVRDRAVGDSARPRSGPARTTARSGTRRTRKRQRAVDRRDEEHHQAGMPAWGTVRKIEPSHFDPAHGVRRGRLPHDGQPQAVHLQDDRLRRDVDERSPAICRRRIRSTT